MAKLLTISLLALAGLLALPQSAEAASPSHSLTYQSGQSACGCPIDTQRVVVGWDHLRRPIHRFHAIPFTHRSIRTTRSIPRPVLRISSCGP